MAERMPAAHVLPLLDEFFRVLAAATHTCGGEIFHMAGDGIMAGFGVDTEDADGAAEALAAGHAILGNFAPIAARWRKELEVEAGIGIGLHLGEVAVGLLGPPRRRTPTLVGDTVNVAARLCSRARAGEVLFSCTVAAALANVAPNTCRAKRSRCRQPRRPAQRARRAIPSAAAIRTARPSGAHRYLVCARRGASRPLGAFDPLNSRFHAGPRGGIGRRNGLKIRRAKISSRFNSGRGHQRQECTVAHRCVRIRSSDSWEHCMKVVGSRRERGIHIRPTGESLAEGARFNEAISWLSQSTFVPKGVYRFGSHEAANKHAEDCLVQGMARLAKNRSSSLER